MGICSSRQKENLLTEVDNIPLLTRGQLGFDIIVKNIKVKMEDLVIILVIIKSKVAK